MINDDLPTDGMAAFENIEAISYNRVLNEIAPVLKTRNKVAEVALARRLSNSFRNQYETISAGH